MEQLCKSRIDAGEYDSMIHFLIRNDFEDESILRELMILTKGHENPAIVIERIEYLREQGE
jgi:hypothetical protein